MAGYISPDDIEKVRNATDLVSLFSEHTQVKQRGHDFWCCCPFHNEKTPSCKIDPEKQLWYCFGCHKHGNVFTFVMDIEGVSFPDAVRELAERAHIQLHITHTSGPSIPQSHIARLRSLCAETAQFYHALLMTYRDPDADQARSYLAGRNLGGQIPKKWNLGYAPGRNQLLNHLRQKGFSLSDMVEANVVVKSSRDGKYRDRFYNRIMFPISDVTGAPIAFGGRVIGKGEPKYLNSSDTPLFSKSRVLYGLDKAKVSMTHTGQAIVVEGYTDVIAMHEGGLTNVVATLGTALTEKHIRILRRHAQDSILYLFDGDSAGQHAIDRALQFISVDMTPEAGSRQIQLYACTIPDDMDPAEYIAAHGGDAMRAYLEAHKKPLIEFGYEFHTAKYHIDASSDWTQRRRAFNDVVRILLPLADTQYAALDYARDFAQRLQVPGDADEVARQAIASLKAEKQKEDRYRRMRASQQSAKGAAFQSNTVGDSLSGNTFRSQGHTNAQVQDGQQRLNGVKHDMYTPVQNGVSQAGPVPQEIGNVQSAPQTNGSAHGVAAGTPMLQMSTEQINEAHFERAFIRVCAEYPQMATTYSSVLLQENWIDTACKQLGHMIADEVAHNPHISSRDLVQKLSANNDAADEILMTADTVLPEQIPAYAAYIAEALQIFDLQHQIDAARFSLSQSTMQMSDDEKEAVFQSIVQMQNMLYALKKTHHQRQM